MSEDKKEKRYLYFEIAEDIEILNKKVSALEKANQSIIRLKNEFDVMDVSEKLKELEKRQQTQSFPFQKMKELEASLMNKQDLFPLHKGRQDKPIMEIIMELEQKVDILFKADKGRCQDIAELDNRKQICDHERNELKAVLRRFMDLIFNYIYGTVISPSLMKPEFEEVIKQLGSEEKTLDEVLPHCKVELPDSWIIPDEEEKEPSEEPIRIEKYDYSGEKLQGKLKSPAEDFEEDDMEAWYKTGMLDRPRSPAEDPNTIHGINVYCPNCGLTQRGVFTSGKEMIAEFINKLKNLIKKHECEFNEGYVAVETGYIEDIIEEYEEARKNQ